MKYCINCTALLNDEDVICKNCGTRFDEYPDGYASQPYANYNPGSDANPGYSANGYATAYYNPDGYNNYGEPEKPKSAALSVAAFISSLFIGPVGLILGIIALATKSAKKGLAIAAIILGTSATVVLLLYVAIFVPMFGIYSEKTCVQSDTAICDLVRMAISTAILDPAVVNAPNNGIPTYDDWVPVRSIDETSPFGQAVTEILGYPPSEIESRLRSSYYNEKASGMQFKIENGQVSVRIEHSDSSGRKGRNGGNPIEAG